MSPTGRHMSPKFPGRDINSAEKTKRDIEKRHIKRLYTCESG